MRYMRKFLLVIAAVIALTAVSGAAAFADPISDEDDCTMSFRCTK